MPRFLIIQTAFLGDVVLATAIVEKLRLQFPDSTIDFLLRKGNENVLTNNPSISRIHIWDKQKGKLRNLWRIAQAIRRENYDFVINAHRGATSGFITWYSGASDRRGFSKNPFSWCFKHSYPHHFSQPKDEHYIHETERNQQLIANITDSSAALPRIFPATQDYVHISEYQHIQYICIAPSSVWFTKRFPIKRWAELMNALPAEYHIYLLGAPQDHKEGEDLIALCGERGISNLCGELSIMQSAALMSKASMNYTNDSGPMHFASAVNAPVTAIYCSTHPCFGFGPLSEKRRVVQVEDLYCKPCGLHGYKACPQGHFRCALDINISELLWWTTPQT